MLVLLDEQSRVLLVRRRRLGPDRWGWEVPGGLVDEGEDPAEAAARELEDSAGYRAGRVEHLITFQPMAGSLDAEHVVFTGQDPERIGEPAGTGEAVRGEWFPLVSVPGLVAAGEVWNGGSLVALLRVLPMDGRGLSSLSLITISPHPRLKRHSYSVFFFKPNNEH